MSVRYESRLDIVSESENTKIIFKSNHNVPDRKGYDELYILTNGERGAVVEYDDIPHLISFLQTFYDTHAIKKPS